MTSSLATVSYIGATILFILSLGGLSNPETARRGNLFGIIGMTVAVLATVFGPRVTAAGIPYIVGALAVVSLLVRLVHTSEATSPSLGSCCRRRVMGTT